ncbi:MAG: magnesium transporter [Gallionellales bacterium RIFCSPLOWO2_12_FULL_59_22]|nr:MAG: magnesium transporter [Gallionellales bacterium RIFCSPLOWO2_02_FULL_59_110]OGT05711.1 MAG: magnesium transporter [Gallionellales bacterium RIFCSPLOWO2_02_58_13]OGT13949.1 MAG: magnesium transporter [Gallionellales bacterium RIFCSPLOWO2_12_FULL_59_22]
MTDTNQENQHYTENVQDHLKQVESLLHKHALVEEVVHKQELPREDRHALLDTLLHKQHLAELQRKLDGLHPADIAYILEALPIEQRLLVWDMVKSERDGEILIEVSDAVRESLIATMNREELRAAAEQLDTDEIADLAPDLPHNVMRDLFRSLPIEEREQLRAAMSYPEDSVGALMDFNMIHVREDISLEVVSRYLRRFDELPDHTDQVFVVDRDDHFRGVLPINLIVVNEPDTIVGGLMLTDTIQLHPDEKAEQAAQAFERYDLVSAPVVDEEGKLVGRVTVNVVLDFIRTESENDLLNQAGLREDEDIFASVWKSVQNRWAWLALNLVTAFIASRVIGIFEDSIEKLVALAALMPIIAGIGGNSGNQSITMIVRALALGQINANNARKLFAKEISVSGLNGLIWGSVVGLFAFLIYHSIPLSLVMTLAMVLNLLVAGLFGVLIPFALHKLGRDPAAGSSVMITAITDSGGFFIFLGLATIFLT